MKYQFEGCDLSLILADGLVCDVNLSDGESMSLSDVLHGTSTHWDFKNTKCFV